MNMITYPNVFPHNGYAFFSDLEEASFQKYIHLIEELEEKTNYEVIKYWDSQWEYPFFLYTIHHHTNRGLVLDAGAGKSLLPYWLYSQQYEVIALDIDDGSFYPQNTLLDWYERMNAILEMNIDFVKGNLLDLKYPDKTFDTVCSMSVIEHLEKPLESIKELWRVLKFNGVLIVSVDISLDRTRQLYITDYLEIVRYLDTVGISIYKNTDANQHQIITTDWFKTNQPESLPWKTQKRKLSDRLFSLIRGKLDGITRYYTPFHSMTVAGLAYKKNEYTM